MDIQGGQKDKRKEKKENFEFVLTLWCLYQNEMQKLTARVLDSQKRPCKLMQRQSCRKTTEL